MKTRFLPRILLCLMFYTVFCAIASAVTIDRVDITGNKRIPEDSIRPYLVAAGSEFDPERISRTISQLHETNFFLEISVDAAVINNQFVVTYILQETPLVADVRAEGLDKVTDSKIKETISVKPGEPLNFTLVGASIKAIQDLYDSEKLYNAKIEYDIEYLSETAVNVVFKIDEGKKARVYNIWFYGNENVSNDDLKAVMRTKEKNFWGIMNSSGMLLRDMLEIDRELVRQHYLSLGYATVEVGEPQISNQEEDQSRMNYLMRIKEGPRFKISSIDFTETLGLFTVAELNDAIGLKVGEYFNATQYRKDILALTEKYSELGYAMANVDPVTELNPADNTVSITFKVEEGKIYKINRIEFTGNENTRDNVLRREFDIKEGDVYNSKLIKEGERNLRVTSFFADIRIAERPVEGDAIDIVVNVDEAKNGSINFAIAYSSVDGLVGRIEFAQANLFGYGSTLRVFAELELSGDRQNYQLSYTEPWVFDHPYSFGVDVYSREKEYDEYTKRAQGFALRVGHQPIKRRLFLNYMFSHETVDIYDIATGANQYIKSEEGKTTINSITPSLTFSNVNSNLDPTEGLKATVRLKYAGTFLGGDVDYVKLTGEASYYQSLPSSFVGVLHAEAGQMWAIDGSRLPIDDRFYLGGIYTVRGFKSREISPKDASGYSYGGDKYYMFNAELWRPIFEGTVGVRLVVFFDMGQVFDDNESFGSVSPRMAAGAGIRLFTPMGLLRLEGGYKLDKKDDEDPYRIEFSIGSSF